MSDFHPLDAITYVSDQPGPGLWIAKEDERPFASMLGLVKEPQSNNWLDEMTGIWIEIWNKSTGCY